VTIDKVRAEHQDLPILSSALSDGGLKVGIKFSHGRWFIGIVFMQGISMTEVC